MLRKMSRRMRDLVSVALSVAGAGDMPVESTAVSPGIVAESAHAATAARFTHLETDTELPLSGREETFIGRFDSSTGFQPDIELKPLDTSRSTSRRHARVRIQGHAYLLREEIGVANGTFVNGERLTTGVEVEIKDGDEVRFGLVATVFHVE